MNTTPMTPMVYTIKEIQEILGLSQGAAYRLVTHDPPFRVLKIGGTYRIPKEGFNAWINAVRNV